MQERSEIEKLYFYYQDSTENQKSTEADEEIKRLYECIEDKIKSWFLDEEEVYKHLADIEGDIINHCAEVEKQNFINGFSLAIRLMKEAGRGGAI